MSTDLTTTDDATGIAELSAEEAELAASVRGKIDRRDLILPMLKLAQGLTAEVSEGKATAGQFVNSLTGEAVDGPVELVIVDYIKGRFFSPRDAGTYVAFSDVVPDNWPPEYAGQHFADLDDAEERYAERANSGAIQWGSGPPIRTTFNYVGFPVDDPDLPVRVSLQRTSRDAARKLNTLLDTSPTPWGRVYELTAVRKESDNGSYYVFDVGRGRKTSEDERKIAVQLIKSIRGAANVTYHGDEETEAKPKADVPEADPEALSV